MARVSLVPVWVILSLLCCFCASFVASLSAPVRGYQHSYSSEQTQSYDSETGAFSSVTVTSRQCNVIKRMTQYETVRVPFLCQVATGRVVPLPPDMESPNRDQILSAMQAGGWSICYQPITVPIYRYQRIPVCCPGTTPTRDGRCICKKEVQDPVVVPAPGQLLNSNSKMHSDQKPPVYPGYEYKPAPATPIRVQPPRPYRGILGHVPPGNIKPNSLLQQVTLAGTQGGPSYTVTNDRGPNPYNPVGPQYYPRGSSPPQLVRPSPLRPLATPGGEGVEWQGDIARYLAAMMYQKLLVEQQEKILQEEISRQLRLKQQMELILDHQRRVAQIHHHHQQQQQQQQQQQWLQPPRGRYPTLSSRPPPNPLPRPLPSPPTKMTPTTVPQQEGKESTAAPEAAASDTDTDITTTPTTTPTPISDSGDLQGQEGDGGPVGGRPGETLEETLQGDNTGATHTAATAVDDADAAAAAAAAAPQLGNRPPSNIPPGSQGVPPEVLQLRERVKKIVDDCLRSSGIGSPMEAILQSGDLDQLRPVCRASDTVGPCVMQSVESSLGQDQMGMVGRQMMQSIFVSLGQLCTKLEEADKKANNSPPADDITSPPVFPNPAPSVTQQVVTEGTVEISNSGDNSAATDNNNNNNGINNNNNNNDINNNNNNNNDNVKPDVDTPQDSSNTEAQPLLTVRKESPSEHKTAGDHSPMDMPPLAAAADTPSSIISSSVGAQAHSAKEKKTERETDGTAFPLWMILAMVGACSALLLFSCLTICLVLRCRRKKKTLDLEREPEKLPVPVPAEGNIYAASPCHPPPSYATTAVRQTLGGGEEEVEEEVEEDLEFKIPEDVEEKKEKGDSSVEKALPAAGGEEEEEEKKEKEEEEEK